MIGAMVHDLMMAGLSALVMNEYFKTFLEARKRKTIYGILWLIHFLWQLVSVYVMADVPGWMRIVLGIFCIVVSGCFFVGDFGCKMILSILFVAMSVLGEALVGSCFLIMRISPQEHIFLGAVISEIFLLLFVKALQLFFFNPMVRGLSWKYSVSFLFLPIAGMFLVNHIFSTGYQLKQTGYQMMVSLCMVILIVMNVVVFHLYLRLSEFMEMKYRNSVYKKEFQLLEQHMKEKELIMADFRREKHDLKHQAIWMLQLMEEEEYGKLKDVIMKMAKLDQVKKSGIADTNNSMVDAFVNYKYDIAQKSGIIFHVQLNIPSELPFDGGDLCMILGNALDNALEANQRGNVENPYIDLKIQYDMGNLIIRLENSFDGKLPEYKSRASMTRKADWKNHGMGISSMKDILEKYHGYYETEVREKIYYLNIILYS